MKDDKINIDNLENITHDKLFQMFFGIKNVAADFLKSELPTELLQYIDLNTLVKENAAFVSARFNKSFLDIMYSARFAEDRAIKICFLFEHKSKQPEIIFLQLLGYKLQIWEDALKQAKNKKQKLEYLPLILPIIVHHGKDKWVKRTFYEHFGELPKDFKQYIPHFDYLLKDLTITSNEDLLSVPSDNLLRNLFFALKFAFQPSILKRNIQLVFAGAEIKLEDEGNFVMNFVALFTYILKRGNFSEQEFLELKENILNNDNSDVIMSTYDQIVKKYRAEGEAIGDAKVAQTKKEFAISLIEEFPNFADAKIAKLAKVEEALVRDLRKELDSK